jgi:multidrug efflux system outer membrane protein
MAPFTTLPTLLIMLAGCISCTAPLQIARPADPATPTTFKTPVVADGLQIGSDWWKLFNDPQLDALEQQALALSPTLAIASARVERARAQSSVVAAEFGPRVTADGAVQRFRTSRDVATAPFIGGQRRAIEDNQFSAQAALGWELDVWGRIKASYAVAQAQLLSTLLEADGMRLMLTAEVASTYLQLRGLDDEGRIVNAATQSRRDALRVVQLRYDVGVVTDLDLERARTELANALADASDLARRRNGLENALAQLTGQAPKELRLPLSGTVPSAPVIAAGIPSEMLQRRPDISQALALRSAAFAQTGVAQAAFYPQIRLTGAAGLASSDLTSLISAPARLFSLGPSISIPVLDSGRNQANWRAAQAGLDEAQANFQQKILIALREVDDALSELTHRRMTAQAQQQAITAASRATRVARLRYEKGAASYLEVTDTERTQLAAERALAQTRAAQWVATVQLVRSLGGGWDGS